MQKGKIESTHNAMLEMHTQKPPVFVEPRE
jgi:hypothetical protein